MRYELLANYLESRFGSIYVYNMNGGHAGIDPQPWTHELKEAVRYYLLHELPEDTVEIFFAVHPSSEHEKSTREEQVDELLASREPWEVALAVHDAAAEAVPTLDQLLEELGVVGLKDWPSQDEANDVVIWLETHADADQLKEVVLSYFGAHQERWERFNVLDVNQVIDHLSPADLLEAWHEAVGPAPSDLTDVEWQVLLPLLPVAKNNWAAEQRARRAIDGMLYRHKAHVHWSQIPSRYGQSRTLYARHSQYKRTGVYSRALLALKGEANAERLVEWLTP
jgi:transposase